MLTRNQTQPYVYKALALLFRLQIYFQPDYMVPEEFNLWPLHSEYM